MPMGCWNLLLFLSLLSSAHSCPPQAELTAGAFMDIDEECDDGKTHLMSSAGYTELQPKPCMVFQNFDHAHTWVQLWGAQHQPMKVLPGGGRSKRVYVCRHPAYGKYQRGKQCLADGCGPSCKPGSKAGKALGKKASGKLPAPTAESLAATEVFACLP